MPSKHHQGKYRPKNPRKYRGDSSNIIYRSSWERTFMKYCDLRESVVSWQSEEKCLWYYDPVAKKKRRYFPDFIIKVKESAGQVKTYVVEVKPKKQTQPPKKPKRQTKSYIYECKTYAVNQAKWKAAKDYCADRMWEFKVMTEKELGIK